MTTRSTDPAAEHTDPSGKGPTWTTDPDRLRALRRYEVLDTEPEEAFDAIAELAAHLFDAPIGAINFIDAHRQWFKANTGLATQETDLDVSFCVHTIDRGESLVVEDLAQDSRFEDNPFVTEHGLRFYAGAPLVTPDGHRIGTVCALDTAQRSPSDGLVRQLTRLARMVVDELELRRENARRRRLETALRQSREQYQALFENAEDAIFVLGAKATIQYANEQARALLRDGDDLTGTRLDALFVREQTPVVAELRRAFDEGRPYSVVTELRRKRGEAFWGHLSARPMSEGAERVMRCNIRDVTDRRRADRLQKIQAQLFEQIATGRGRDAVLRSIVRFAEAGGPDTTAAVLTRSEGRLSLAAGTSLPPTLVDRLEDIEVGNATADDVLGTEGLARGNVSSRGWADVRADAEEAGLRVSGAEPIGSDGDLLGLLVVFRPASSPRAAEQTQLHRSLSAVAGVAIEKDRRRTQLRHHRELLGHAQQLSQVGGWAYDVDTGTLRWTEETYRIHGEPVGSPVDVDEALSFFEPEFRPVLRSNIERLVAEGGTYDLEIPLVTGSGDRRWFRTIGTAHQQEGRTVRLTGAIQDVTHRHEVQEELRQQKDRLRTIFDTVPVMIALFDEDGTPQAVNQRVEDVLGWSADALAAVPDPLRHLVPDPDARETARAFASQAADEWTEFRVRTRDDDRVPLRVKTVSLPDGGWVGIGFDVGRQKKRERRLRWAQRLAQLGYWARDLETDELVWSAETRRIFGWSAEADLTYEAFMDAVHPDDRARLRAAQDAVESGESDLDIEYRIRRPSGELRIVYERGELRRGLQGRPVALMGAVLDVTERARRRNELAEAKQAAEEANRIKSALLSNMNHEFRTPLTSIISFSKLVRDNPELADDFADRILGGGNRLLRTLNTVMDFAELEGTELTPTPQIVEVGRIVESTLDDFRRLAARDGLSLELRRPQGRVSAALDPHYLERICMHLCSNAVKFTEEGGVTATVRRRTGVVEVSFEDTGIGIPTEFLPNVYDEFAQASSGDDRTHEGNGLGLTITRRLVEGLGGQIQIESVLGKGTQVVVRLPAESPSDEADLDPEGPAALT